MQQQDKLPVHSKFKHVLLSIQHAQHVLLSQQAQTHFNLIWYCLKYQADST